MYNSVLFYSEDINNANYEFEVHLLSCNSFGMFVIFFAKLLGFCSGRLPRFYLGKYKINCFAELKNISLTRHPCIMLNISILELDVATSLSCFQRPCLPRRAVLTQSYQACD